MKIGYGRVSTVLQNLDLQLDSLKNYGCEMIFTEKISGKNKERPELKKMLEIARPGDQIVIYKLDRLGRSTKDLIEISELLEQRGIELISITDKIDTSTAIGRFYFKVMASLSEFERDLLSERTKAGLIAARKRGKLGGRPPKEQEKIDLALKMYHSNLYTLKEITNATNISTSTLYRNLRKRKLELSNDK